MRFDKKGISVVDWIRFAIAFAFWEEDFVKKYRSVGKRFNGNRERSTTILIT